MSELADLCGVWTLVPERCTYPEPLPAPRSGVYTLLADPEDAAHVYGHARWRDPEGIVEQVAYHLHLDGQPRTLAEAEGIALRSAFEAGELRSELLRGGEVVHRERRSLDDEGLLCVCQDFLLEAEDGTPTWLHSEARYRHGGVKQVLVYRRDLKMRKGKIAAQCAHASMAVFFRRKRASLGELVIPLDGPMAEWSTRRFAKICLSLADESELLAAYEAAQAAGLPCALITDSGRTEFHGVPTRTAIAIGPAANEEIDAITGPQGAFPGKLA